MAYDAALSITKRFTREGIPLGGDAMTYGEFDLPFLARLIELSNPKRGECFVDVGSGSGRAVFAAALIGAGVWGNCHGIEKLSPLHEFAVTTRRSFDDMNSGTQHGKINDEGSDNEINNDDEKTTIQNLDKLPSSPLPPIAPCQYTLSDFGEGPGLEALQSASVVFTYAVTWTKDGTHDRLVRTLARNLPTGSRVISVDLPLRNGIALEEGARFELVAREVGYNGETGEETIGLVYELARG